MTGKLRIDLQILLPQVPGEADACVGRGIGPAVAIHEGSTLLVVFNALRLLAYKDRG